jgi:hypothetical protein
MMQAADHGRLDDPALVEVLHESRLRGVLVEGEVRSGTVVVSMAAIIYRARWNFNVDEADGVSRRDR